MRINELYFSPTGGTKKVVNVIAQAWTGEHRDIDASNPDCDYSAYSFAKEELCVVGVPSFGGRVPAAALIALGQMRAEETPTVLVAAFGNRDYDDTLLELRNALRESGFHVVAALAAVTEHSIMHQYGAGRPNAADVAELCAYAEKIKTALEGGDVLAEVEVKGNTPYQNYGGLPLKPVADKSCTKCGACARACPVRAIPPEAPEKTNKERCITCMRCVAICPQHARKLNAAVLFAAGQKMKKSCSAPKKNECYIGASK